MGKKTTDFLLEILNLNKTEVISIDIISNQEFTEVITNRMISALSCAFCVSYFDLRFEVESSFSVRI